MLRSGETIPARVYYPTALVSCECCPASLFYLPMWQWAEKMEVAAARVMAATGAIVKVAGPRAAAAMVERSVGLRH